MEGLWELLLKRYYFTGSSSNYSATEIQNDANDEDKEVNEVFLVWALSSVLLVLPMLLFLN